MIDLNLLQLIGTGSVCKCFVFNETLVIKTYAQMKARNDAFIRQKRAFEVGIAPPAYYRTRGKYQGDIRYVYISARAEVRWRYNEDYPWVIEEMKKLGYGTADCCYTNLGYWNGKPVVIDFGSESVGEHV